MKLFNKILPFLTGLANSLLGAGGGIIAVSYLKNKSLNQKQAQATALTVTFFLSLITAVYYLFKGYMKLSEALIYIPFGIPGAITGSLLLKKLPDKILKKLFAIIMLFSGYRMLFGR